MYGKLLTIQQVANLLGVSTKTLRRWDQRGRLVPTRTAGNQRRYTQEQIQRFKISHSAKASAVAEAMADKSEAPPLFSENDIPKGFKATHALPSVLRGLPSGSFFCNLFLLQHKDEISKIESIENLKGSSEPASSARRRLAELNTVKMGFAVASLVLILSLAGA